MTIEIRLNHGQMQALQPLYDQVYEAWNDGKRGVIIFQAWHDGRMTGDFIPHDRTNKILKILKEKLIQKSSQKLNKLLKTTSL